MKERREEGSTSIGVTNLIHDHALFAHVETSLTGTLVRAVLQTHHILSFSQLLLREFTLILRSKFWTQHGTSVFRVSLALPTIRKIQLVKHCAQSSIVHS